ncbi:MAG: hypothetical protein QW390_04720 [Candidatus Bathyarchaeia archaeon]
MSEEVSEKEVKAPEATSTVDVNVALVMAERDELKEKLKQALDKIEELKKKLENAEALIMEDSKATLVNKIAPRTTVPKSVLSKMTVDELMRWDKILDTATPAFKSGAFLSTKTSEREKLDNIHSEYMSKLRRNS